jgi:hypothetical protein
MVSYVDGEEEREISLHLRGCAACRSFRNEVAWGRVLIRRALARPEPIGRVSHELR